MAHCNIGLNAPLTTLLNEPIWQPSRRRIAASNLQRFIATQRAHLSSGDYGALYDWSVAEPAAVLGRGVALLRDSIEHGLHRRRSQRGANAGRTVVRRRDAEFRGEPAAPRTERPGDHLCERARRANRARLGRARATSRERSRGSAAARRRPRRSRRGLRREPPRDRRRDARDRELGGGLVVVLARLRRGCRARSLRPNRAESAVRDRRLLLQRQEHRLAAARAHDRGAPAGVARRGRGSVSRSASRSSALCRTACCSRTSRTARREPQFEPVPFDHPLYILYSSGTTGRAEMHRARRGRHVASASQGARAAHGHPARRRRVLFHDVRLDDVELARVGARVGGDARALRWRAVASGRRRAVATRGTRAHQRVRHERATISMRSRNRRTRRTHTSSSARCARCSRPARRSRRRASTSSIAA